MPGLRSASHTCRGPARRSGRASAASPWSRTPTWTSMPPRTLSSTAATAPGTTSRELRSALSSRPPLLPAVDHGPRTVRCVLHVNLSSSWPPPRASSWLSVVAAAIMATRRYRKCINNLTGAGWTPQVPRLARLQQLVPPVPRAPRPPLPLRLCAAAAGGRCCRVPPSSVDVPPVVLQPCTDGRSPPRAGQPAVHRPRSRADPGPAGACCCPGRPARLPVMIGALPGMDSHLGQPLAPSKQCTNQICRPLLGMTWN